MPPNTLVPTLVSLSLLPLGVACTGDAPADAAMYMALGSETPTQIYQAGLDSESFGQLTLALGYTPVGLGDLGPRNGGAARVRLEIAPDAATSFFDLSYEAMAGGASPSSELALVISAGGTEPALALLLPAIQNYTSSGVDDNEAGHVQLLFEVEGPDASIRDFTSPVPAPQPAADSFFDVTFELSAGPEATAAERTLLVAAAGPHGADRAYIGSAAIDGTRSVEQVTFSRGNPSVAEVARQGLEFSGAIDVRDPDGTPVFRSRIHGARIIDNGDGTATAVQGDARTITFTGLEAASTDDSRHRALFQSDYTSYDSTAVDTAARSLVALRDALDVSAKDALVLWHGGIRAGVPVAESRTATVAKLVEAVIDAAVSENLACTMATPGSIKAGKDPAINGGLDRDIIRRTAGRLAEAMFVMPTPGRHTITFKHLLVSSLGATPASTGDTAPMCEAVITLAELLSDAVEIPALTATEQLAIKQLGAALRAHRAAYLDRVAFELVEHLNAATPTEIGIEGAWLTAAKTKADILIESLNDERANGPVLQAASARLLGL